MQVTTCPLLWYGYFTCYPMHGLDWNKSSHFSNLNVCKGWDWVSRKTPPPPPMQSTSAQKSNYFSISYFLRLGGGGHTPRVLLPFFKKTSKIRNFFYLCCLWGSYLPPHLGIPTLCSHSFSCNYFYHFYEQNFIFMPLQHLWCDVI